MYLEICSKITAQLLASNVYDSAMTTYLRKPIRCILVKKKLKVRYKVKQVFIIFAISWHWFKINKQNVFVFDSCANIFNTQTIEIKMKIFLSFLGNMWKYINWLKSNVSITSYIYKTDTIFKNYVKIATNCSFSCSKPIMTKKIKYLIYEWK